MNSEPVVVKDYNKSFMFGLVSIDYYVEDRRPDLETYKGKYKHYITVKIFYKQYNWLFRTDTKSYTSMPWESKR